MSVSLCNIISSKPQIWTAYLVGIQSHTSSCHSISQWERPTKIGCEGAVDPPVGRCVITPSVKVRPAPPFSDKWEGCGERGSKPDQPWAKGALCSRRVGLHRWKLQPCHSTSFTSFTGPLWSAHMWALIQTVMRRRGRDSAAQTPPAALLFCWQEKVVFRWRV